MNIKFDKNVALTAASALLGIGSFVVDILNKKDETAKIAEQAAKIVMEKQSNN